MPFSILFNFVSAPLHLAWKKITLSYILAHERYKTPRVIYMRNLLSHVNPFFLQAL
jgi:hypothetical protein